MTPLGRWSAAGAAVLGVLVCTTWDAGAATQRPRSAAQLDGADLFQSKGCAQCHHGPASRSFAGDNFPSLTDVTRWAGDRRPGMSAEDYLVESIAAPDAFTAPGANGMGPTTAMPTLGLSAEEIDAIVDHLLEPSR